MLHCEENLTQTDSCVFLYLFILSHLCKKCREPLRIYHLFYLLVSPMQTRRTHAVHVGTCNFTHKKMLICLLFFTFMLFLYASLSLVFSPHLQETAYEILITMHYQDYVLSLLRSIACMCIS